MRVSSVSRTIKSRPCKGEKEGGREGGRRGGWVRRGSDEAVDSWRGMRVSSVSRTIVSAL